MKLPMVEIFETVEGEGTQSGFPTIFVRVYNCNLRCTWCDTKYSYAPHAAEFMATIPEIVAQVKQYPHERLCLTGGEPLMHGEKSLALLQALAGLEQIQDLHVETNGAIDLKPFHDWRKQAKEGHKVRFIMDVKLPASGEADKMVEANYQYLTDQDELKFVIADRDDFEAAVEKLSTHYRKGIPLFSPVWGMLEPATLVKWMLEAKLSKVKLNLQLHKYIWAPDARGV